MKFKKGFMLFAAVLIISTSVFCTISFSDGDIISDITPGPWDSVIPYEITLGPWIDQQISDINPGTWDSDDVFTFPIV